MSDVSGDTWGNCTSYKIPLDRGIAGRGAVKPRKLSTSALRGFLCTGVMSLSGNGSSCTDVGSEEQHDTRSSCPPVKVSPAGYHCRAPARTLIRICSQSVSLLSDRLAQNLHPDLSCRCLQGSSWRYVRHLDLARYARQTESQNTRLGTQGRLRVKRRGARGSARLTSADARLLVQVLICTTQHAFWPKGWPMRLSWASALGSG